MNHLVQVQCRLYAQHLLKWKLISVPFFLRQSRYMVMIMLGATEFWLYALCQELFPITKFLEIAYVDFQYVSACTAVLRVIACIMKDLCWFSENRSSFLSNIILRKGSGILALKIQYWDILKSKYLFFEINKAVQTS